MSGKTCIVTLQTTNGQIVAGEAMKVSCKISL